MQIFDIHNGSKSVIALANRDITINEMIPGVTIDTAGFQALEFLFQVGTITDGIYDVRIEEGNDPNLTDAVDASDEHTLGVINYSSINDNSSERIGYIGKKRFVRIVVNSNGVTSGVDAISSIALLANSHHQPTSNQ